MVVVGVEDVEVDVDVTETEEDALVVVEPELVAEIEELKELDEEEGSVLRDEE